MTHRLRRLLIISALIAIALLLTWYWSRPSPVLISVQTVERGSIQSSVANTRAGSVEACRRARLAPSIGGLIAELPIKQGDQVKTGQLLLALWNEDLTAQVTLAEREAAAAAARAREACTTAEVARHEANRLKSLRQQNLASEDDYERAAGNARARDRKSVV